ncbi:MAG: type VI secretion system tip protein TssI/VgrG [Polyangiales bacterium]
MDVLGMLGYRIVVDGEEKEDWHLVEAVLDEALHELPLWTFDVLMRAPVATSILGKSFEFSITRMSDGQVETATLERKGAVIGVDQMHRVDPSTYRARLRVSSKAWRLTLARRRRVFRATTGGEVLNQLFSDAGLSSTIPAVRRTRDSITQFDETDYDFARRICEDEGLSLLFAHDDSQKVTVIDGASASVFTNLGPFDYEAADAGVANVQTVSAFSRELRAAPSETVSTEWDPTAAKVLTAKHKSPQHFADAHKAWRQETWQSPVAAGYLPTASHVTQATTNLSEALSQVHDLYRGESGIEAFRPGVVVTLVGLDGHESGDEFLLTRVLHRFAEEKDEDGRPTIRYRNDFECVVSGAAHRPARVVPRPVALAPMLAVVADFPDREEGMGWCEVQVTFPWCDDTARQTAWARVSQTLAGNGFGAQFIPRPNMEVVVQFIDGDPDRPMITGVVYNGVHAPPYKLPDAHSRSGIRTRSFGGSTPDNEIFFEDADGAEVLGLVATKDHTFDITNDATVTIGNNRTQTVAADDKLTVSGGRTVTVEKDRTATVRGNEKATVEKDMRTTIYGKLTISADGGVVIQCGDTKLELTPTNATLSNSAGVKLALSPSSAKLENPAAGSLDASGPGVTVKSTGGAQVALVGPMVNLN